VNALFSPTSELLEDVKGFLPEFATYVQAEGDTEDRTTTLKKIQHSLKAISQGVGDTTGIRVENCVGFTQVPVGLGPLRINGEYSSEKPSMRP
jgi:hydroxymethylglutaryl-CoA reductase